jgi:hypothetical protein
VNVWPVQDNKNQYTDYHGHFNAEKFECLFDTICHAIQLYGSWIIHMNGASYHKHRTNPVPTAASTKSDLESEVAKDQCYRIETIVWIITYSLSISSLRKHLRVDMFKIHVSDGYISRT